MNQKKKQEKQAQNGEGNDQLQGDKGKIEGNPMPTVISIWPDLLVWAKFGLNGRRLESRGKVTQLCNQEGVVVVRITVDRKELYSS